MRVFPYIRCPSPAGKPSNKKLCNKSTGAIAAVKCQNNTDPRGRQPSGASARDDHCEAQARKNAFKINIINYVKLRTGGAAGRRIRAVVYTKALQSPKAPCIKFNRICTKKERPALLSVSVSQHRLGHSQIRPSMGSNHHQPSQSPQYRPWLQSNHCQRYRP
jgi:hypothetical protein